MKPTSERPLQPAKPSAATTWPAGDGEMARRIREFDWAKTPLGPIAGWPQSLRTTIDIALASAVATVVLWGPDDTLLYNAAWRDTMRDKHPTALGQPASACFPEVEDTVAPLRARARRGEPVVLQDARLSIRREGELRDAWWNVQYVPVRDEAGAVAGLLCTVIETTAALQAKRERDAAAALLEEQHARAGTRLAASEAKYRSLFATTDNAFCIVEIIRNDGGAVTDWTWLEVNPYFERQSGLGDVVGKRASGIAPGLVHAWSDALARVADSGVTESTEIYLRNLDRWSRVNYALVGGTDSRVIMATFHDITTRKRREADQALLVAVADDLSRLRTSGEIIQAVGTRLAEHLNSSACLFMTVNREYDEITVVHDWHKAGGPSLKQTFRIADYLTEDFLHASHAGQTFVVRDTAHDARTNAHAYARLGIGAFVQVPFPRDGHWVASLAVIDAAPRDWRDHEIELVTAVADRVFPRIERADAESALRASEGKYRTLFDSIDEGFCIIEVLFDDAGKPCDYRFLEVNPAFVRQTGLAAARGKTMRQLAPDHEAFWYEAYGSIALTGKARRFEHQAAALGKWYDVYAFRVGNPDERRVALLFNDVLARKLAEQATRDSEQRLQVLVAELQHRTRNLIAVVGALAGKTREESSSLDDFQSRFLDRLQAIARVQGVLSRASGDRGIAFDELLHTELQALGALDDPRDRVALDGPTDVELRAGNVQTLALALHELATNAMKYGALATPGGRLAVSWRVVGAGSPRLEVEWRETGVDTSGQHATLPDRGYGRELIERALPYQLNARTRYELRPDGAFCSIAVPLSKTTAARSDSHG